MARRHSPPRGANAADLVLADVMTRQLDDFGLLTALRADPRTRDIPVIMPSARELLARVDTALAAVGT